MNVSFAKNIIMLIFDERKHENNITKIFDKRRFKYIIMTITNALYKNNKFVIITKVNLL